MTRRYTPEEKAKALALLQAHHGNIGFTHLHTGIPERTLYSWRKRLWEDQKLQQLQQRDPLPPPQQIPEFDQDSDALKFLREQIMEQLLTTATISKDDLAFSTPYQRALVLSQLLDRLIKLDHYIPRTEQEQVIRIEYQYPDGLIYDRPPWADHDEEPSLIAKFAPPINQNEADHTADPAFDDHFLNQDENL